MLERVYYNGDFLNIKDLHIHGTDLGIHRGYGIFDFMKLRNRTNPWMDWYMERLENSLSQTRLSIHQSREELLKNIDLLLDENKVDDAYVKIVVTAGNSSNGYTRNQKENIFIYAMELPTTDIGSIATSVLISDEYLRDMPGVKTTNYMRSCILQPDMDKVGAIDVLYHWKGEVSEASRSNIFVIKNGVIKTPGEGILNGITRQRVLAVESDILIKEAPVKLTEVMEADELFITSSTKGIMPITAVDGHTIGSGQSGPISLRLMKEVNVF